MSMSEFIQGAVEFIVFCLPAIVGWILLGGEEHM